MSRGAGLPIAVQTLTAGLTLILGVAASSGVARCQQAPPAPPRSATTEEASGTQSSLRDRVLAAVNSRPSLVESNALQDAVPPEELLAAALSIWNERRPEHQDPAARARLIGLVVSGSRAPARTPEQDQQLAEVCREVLAEPAQRDRVCSLPLRLPPELQRTCVPALIAVLDDPDGIGAREACRVLGKIGPPAEEALPALRSVVERERTRPAAPAAPARAIEQQSASKGVLHDALMARMKISGNMAIDVELMPLLGAEGQQEAALTVGMAAGMTSGRFDDVPEHALALTDFFVEWLRTRDDVSKQDFVGLALLALTSDAAEPEVRARSLAVVRELAARDQDPCAAAMAALLAPPESVCRVDVPPAHDPRELVVLRRFGLTDLAATDGGWMAVSVLRYGTDLDFPRPTRAVVKLWNVASGEETATINGPYGAASFAGHDDRLLLVGTAPPGSDGHAAIVAWEPGGGHAVVSSGEARADRCRPLSLAGAPQLLTLGPGRALELLNPATGKTLSGVVEDAEPFGRVVAGSADGSRLVLDASDRRLLVLDAATFAVVATLAPPEIALAAALGDAWAQVPPPGHFERYYKPPPAPMPTAALLAPDNASVFCADHWGALVQRSVPSGEPVRVFATSGAFAQALAISRDGRLLAAANPGTWASGKPATPDDFVVRVFEIESGREIARLTGMQSAAEALQFSADGRQLAALSKLAVRVWELR